MFKKNKFAIILIIILVFTLLTACQNNNKSELSSESTKTETKKETASEFLMDTIVDMQVFGKEADKVIEKSFNRMREIEDEMSKSIEKSDVSKINKNAANGWVEIEQDTFTVIKKAVDYAKLTNGNFDPTIGPLVELWGIGTDKAKIPTESEIDKVKKLVNYKNIELDKKKQSIRLKRKEMKIDLGGIAKGYAADEVRNIANSYNIKSAYVNLGGNVLVIGGKEDGTPWKIGIQDPRKSRGSVMAGLEVKDKTVVTSGNYERYFEKDGIIYHHILNPETGKPTRNNLLSVSIIANDSFEADVLSTSAFILGRKNANKLIENKDEVEAIFVTEDLKVYLTSGLKGKVEILDSDFKLIEGD